VRLRLVHMLAKARFRATVVYREALGGPGEVGMGPLAAMPAVMPRISSGARKNPMNALECQNRYSAAWGGPFSGQTRPRPPVEFLVVSAPHWLQSKRDQRSTADAGGAPAAPLIGLLRFPPELFGETVQYTRTQGLRLAGAFAEGDQGTVRAAPPGFGGQGQDNSKAGVIDTGPGRFF